MKYNKSNHGFTLVELMVVVAIIGILSAIAIPAFRRYIQSSRASEAEILMDWMTKGAVSYYTTEQRFSSPMNGDQPWHVGSSNPGVWNSYGMPVKKNVFPGGTFSFNTDGGEGNSFDCSAAPKGGEKHLSNILTGSIMLTAVIKKLRFENPGAMYFQYAYSAMNAGPQSTATIVAGADFKQGNLCHQISRTIRIRDGEVVASPKVLTNEFQ